MDIETWAKYNAPRLPASWCGRCAACAAVRRVASVACGCPAVRGNTCPQASETFTIRVTVPRRGTGPATPECLDALGGRLAHGLYWRHPVSLLPRLKPTHVLSEAVAVAERQRRGLRSADADCDLTAQQGLVLVVSHLAHLVEQGDLSPQTVNKMASEMASLVSYATASHEKPTLRAITGADVRGWLHAAFGGRRHRAAQPSLNTRHSRLTAARMFFRVLRHLGTFSGDPTLDISLPPRRKGTTRPVRAEEMLLLQYAVTDQSISDSPRLAACLALAQAGVFTGELAGVLVRDVDLARRRVWLSGTRQRSPRWAYLSEWGVRHLAAWMERERLNGAGPDDSVVYGGDGSPESQQAAACWAMSEILRRAGLRGETDLKPNSIPAYYGLRIYRATGELELARAALGATSLDTTARLLGVLQDRASAAHITGHRADEIAASVNGREPAGSGPYRDRSAAASTPRAQRGGRPRRPRAVNVRRTEGDR